MRDNIPELPKPKPSDLLEGTKALGEAAAMAAGADLSSREELNKVNALFRSDRVDDHLHKVAVLGIYFIAFCFAVVLGVLIYHIVTPERLHFLSDDELGDLRTFLFSSGLGVGVSTVGKKVLKIEDKK